jgi:coenzyme F420-reducing hydrogenase delta subunit
VFGCDHGARCQDAAEAVPDVVAISLLCSGQLPPSFVEYALRDGAAGVVVATCRAGGCEYRFGERWTIERLQGQREPHLRASVDPSRLEIALVGAGDEEALAAATQRLRLRVQSLMPRTELIAQPSHA